MKRQSRPYLDRGVPGTLRYQRDGALPLVKDPVFVPPVLLSLQSLRRHNTISPALEPTHRLFLRWGEGGGSGMPNPEADVRELHYDPLPPDLHEKVDDIVDSSPWETFMRKWYRTTLSGQELADAMCISRTQLYADWRAALWYFRGRLEAAGLHG